jgi:hypothetical protein
MPTTPLPKTRAELEAEDLRLLEDRLEQQNTAARVRKALHNRDDSFYNKREDKVPVGRIDGLLGATGRIIAGLLPPPNARPGGPFHLDHWLIEQEEPGVLSSLERLPAALLCIGCQITIRLGDEAGRYEVVEDQSTPPELLVASDGYFRDGDLIGGKVVPLAGGAGSGGLVVVDNVTEGLGGFRVGQSYSLPNNDAWNKLLKQDQAPAASLTASNPQRQPGASPTVSLFYEVSARTHPLQSITLAGQNIPLTQLSGVVQTATAFNTDTTFPLVATDTDGVQTQRTASVRYQPLRFWFVSAVDPLSLSDAGLSALVRSQLGQEYSSDRTQSRTFQASGQYLCFAWVASAGAGSFKVNGLLNNAFQGRDFQFTNSESYTQTFRVSRSAQLLTGTFTADVF